MKINANHKKSYLSKILNAAAIAATIFFVASKFNDRTFSNNDNPRLELFLKSFSNERIYLDGARPFFIQRNSINNVYFYDLNSRLQDPRDFEKIYQIKKCFLPTLWVITNQNKNEDVFNLLKNEFQGIIYSDKKSFVAMSPARDINYLGSCRDFSMKK